MTPLGPIQPLASPSIKSQYLADALRSMQASGSQDQSPGALGPNLMAQALLQGQQQKQGYAHQLQANGIDPTLDPGAGPQSGFDKLKTLLGPMFGLGQAS